MSAFDLIDAKLKQQAKPSPIADAFKRAMYEAGQLGEQMPPEAAKRKPGRPPKQPPKNHG